MLILEAWIIMFPEDENGPGQTRTLPSSNSETPIPDTRGAKCVALPNDLSHSDPQLHRLIGAWATLNQAAREQIEQIIEHAGGDQSETDAAGGSYEN